MEALLERHVLNGLVDAPWVRTDDLESDDDDRFFAALQELVAYAFEESVRIKKKGLLFPGWHEIPARSSRGILQEVQALLQKYRSELVDYRWGAGDVDRYRTIAAELVALTPDVIVALGYAIVSALQKATRSVPIVFMNVIDPVGGGSPHDQYSTPLSRVPPDFAAPLMGIYVSPRHRALGWSLK
jgi:ABC transporter substrate binding protein